MSKSCVFSVSTFSLKSLSVPSQCFPIHKMQIIVPFLTTFIYMKVKMKVYLYYYKYEYQIIVPMHIYIQQETLENFMSENETSHHHGWKIF